MTAAVRFRPALPGDLLACERVWRLSLDAYLGPMNVPPVPEENPGLRRLHAHTLATDPERFWVATRGGGGGGAAEEVVAFGAAVQRGTLWFLSMLFVLPGAQGAGLGRRLLGRIGPDPGVPAGELVRATATDSAQPISNALYASLGIVPRMPLWHLVGEPSGGQPLPALPGDVTARPLDAGLLADGDVREVDGLDARLFGASHAQDRPFLVADARRGYGYRDGAGRLVAYGYASEAGRVGPVAAEDPALVAPVLGHLLGAVPPRGAAAVWVAGAADRAVVALLAAGFRLEPFPILLCWDRPFADFSRYLPISPGLL